MLDVEADFGIIIRLKLSVIISLIVVRKLNVLAS